MVDVRPTREKGHLVVAAIRVHRHKAGTPPGPKDIAELLEWGVEETHVVLHGLVIADILILHESPFEACYEIKKYPLLEELPGEEEQDALEDEVVEFKRANKSKQDELEKMFDSGEVEEKKKSQMENLEEDFSRFKEKSRRFPG